MKVVAASLVLSAIGCAPALAEQDLREQPPVSLSAAQVYAVVSPSLCSVIAADNAEASVVLGSGFVVSTDGDVVTNAHVVLDRPRIAVKCGGRVGDVTGVARLSKTKDLAQLRTNLTGVRPVTLAKAENTKPGASIFVLGSPQGLDGTISSGIVSAIRNIEGVRHLQITAPISKGSSGGPVVNEQGKVIGVATSILETGQNLNFAVSVSELQSIAIATASIDSLGAVETSSGGRADRFEWISIDAIRDGENEIKEPSPEQYKTYYHGDIKVTGDIRRAWFKSRHYCPVPGEFADGSVKPGVSLFGAKEIVTLSSYNCRKETARQEALTVYWCNGTVDSSSDAGQWEPLIPGVESYFRMVFICHLPLD